MLRLLSKAVVDKREIEHVLEERHCLKKDVKNPVHYTSTLIFLIPVDIEDAVFCDKRVELDLVKPIDRTQSISKKIC